MNIRRANENDAVSMSKRYGMYAVVKMPEFAKLRHRTG